MGNFHGRRAEPSPRKVRWHGEPRCQRKVGQRGAGLGTASGPSVACGAAPGTASGAAGPQGAIWTALLPGRQEQSSEGPTVLPLPHSSSFLREMGARCCLHPSGYLIQSCTKRSKSSATLAEPLICCPGAAQLCVRGQGQASTCKSRTAGLQAGGKEGFQNEPWLGVSTGTFSAAFCFCEQQV